MLKPTNNQNWMTFRLLLALAGFCGCLFGVIAAVNSGTSQALTAEALALKDPELVSKAVRLAPANPDAHIAYGVILSEKGNTSAAVNSFRRAASLTPGDYSTWLQLGLAQAADGDSVGAVTSLREAVRLAPYYAKPHWELGKVLLNLGIQPEAFTELRRAAQSDSLLVPSFFDLAWTACEGKSEQVVRAIDPQHAHARVSLARFLAEKGALLEAKNLLLTIDSPLRERQRLSAKLISSQKHRDALELWLSTAAVKEGSITDASFESGELTMVPGFFWQMLRNLEGVVASINRDDAHSGSASLRLDFRGATKWQQVLLKQLVVLESNAHYQLRYAARAEDLSSDGPLQLLVREANPNGRLLAASTHDDANRDWKIYTVEFETSEGTDAIDVIITRQKCHRAPCPMFGRAWFDSFSLRKL